jgi:hypothetical protein
LAKAPKVVPAAGGDTGHHPSIGGATKKGN